MKPYLFIQLVFCFTVSARAQKLDIPTGKTFEITKHTKQTGTYQKDELYTYAFKGLGKDKDGNNLLEGKIVRVIYYDSKQGTTILNTDSIRKTDFNYAYVLTALAVLNKPFTLNVNSSGEVLATNGLQEALQEGFDKWHIKNDFTKNLLSNSRTEFSAALNGMFLLPDLAKAKTTNKTGVPNADTKSPFTLNYIDANTLQVRSSLVTDTNNYSREIFIDKQTGLLKNSISKNNAKLKGHAVGSMASKPVIINSTTTQALTATRVHPPVDTAWINMASKLSYWSVAYNKGINSDREKVLALAKKPDSRFMNDKYYLVRRLQLVQTLRGVKDYGIYDSVLLATPNKYLEGNEAQLHNKLNSVLYNQGAVAAYELSKYAYKTNAFDDYLQYTFAQYLKDGRGNEDAVSIKRYYDLLALFKTNTDPVYLGKITPLYLWAIAKQNKNDIAFLVKTAQVFERMDDKHMLAGNAGRYALLMYQMLVASKQPVAANVLMEATINKLERYTADTLNKNRYAHQNLLAGAYYLKYLNQNTAGDPDASRYLAAAAKYSPLSQEEKSYGSFYDRLLLNTKESYRDMFVDKLLNAGNEAEALKLFAEHVNAMPDQIVEMQSLYAKKFPGKDFKQFFNDRIMSTWPLAPAFALKAMDGKQHELTEYKGKWLVLDFWGTWCGPCRAEMPVVNKFSDEVIAGKYTNVDFLSIACSDTENAVKEYLNETKFAMPVVLSDGLVQNNYKIRGYPSKIIISPQGRMIMVDFGKDWQTVIKNFSKM
jgi:thiol-disulfide isomerase/thioredoxin